ncbi:hypothetical protein T492DRAFT_988775 [Pavlovales sp. CCMP2436]|nr:hypothetical protein T492DRAFT_988775 [Pavlovales sp. CCMP2436]
MGPDQPCAPCSERTSSERMPTPTPSPSPLASPTSAVTRTSKVACAPSESSTPLRTWIGSSPVTVGDAAALGIAGGLAAPTAADGSAMSPARSHERPLEGCASTSRSMSHSPPPAPLYASSAPRTSSGSVAEASSRWKTSVCPVAKSSPPVAAERPPPSQPKPRKPAPPAPLSCE